jgi:hypothetical protein
MTMRFLLKIYADDLKSASTTRKIVLSQQTSAGSKSVPRCEFTLG